MIKLQDKLQLSIHLRVEKYILSHCESPDIGFPVPQTTLQVLVWPLEIAISRIH